MRALLRLFLFAGLFALAGLRLSRAPHNPPQVLPVPVPVYADNTSAPENSKTSLVRLNTARLEELETLPGIGPALARRIVEDREAHGPFRTASEITRVRGIGPRKWDALRPFVRP